MPRKPNVDFRKLESHDETQGSGLDWAPSVVVLAIGLLLFGIIEILIHV
ncbi:MAG TPA: hypothetical protein VL282_19490 [Tepidisphaeraceae bacterium]|jgi:hypothetical protein|nr:hypothetical protein [Tepidisphaeraceae bacterium]